MRELQDMSGRLVLRRPSITGESPVWCERTARLYWCGRAAAGAFIGLIPKQVSTRAGRCRRGSVALLWVAGLPKAACWWVFAPAPTGSGSQMDR